MQQISRSCKQINTIIQVIIKSIEMTFKLRHIRLNIYLWKTKFPFHKQFLFGILFARNAKEAHTVQSILQTFLLCLKRNISQNLSMYKYFANVYVTDTTCFDGSFKFHMITGRRYKMQTCINPC